MNALTVPVLSASLVQRAKKTRSDRGVRCLTAWLADGTLHSNQWVTNRQREPKVLSPPLQVLYTFTVAVGPPQTPVAGMQQAP